MVFRKTINVVSENIKTICMGYKKEVRNEIRGPISKTKTVTCHCCYVFKDEMTMEITLFIPFVGRNVDSQYFDCQKLCFNQ